MSKWSTYRLAMWVLVVLMTWAAAAVWMDGEVDFQMVFFSVFGLVSFVMLAVLTLMDILNISWGAKSR